jgi:hypothetical protein
MGLAVERLTLRTLAPALRGATFDAAHPVPVTQQRTFAEPQVRLQVVALADAQRAGADLGIGPAKLAV